MKTVCFATIALLLVGPSTNAQITGFSLNEDPIFSATVAQHVRYPVTAVRGSIYGRFYAKFSIDSVGRIQNITVLHPKINPKYNQRLGFEYEIINGLKQLPQMTPRYRGSYILPIAFVYINYSEDSRPRVPTNTLPEKYLDNSLIMNEVKIVGRSNMYRTVRPFSGIAPASRQVVLF